MSAAYTDRATVLLADLKAKCVTVKKGQESAALALVLSALTGLVDSLHAGNVNAFMQAKIAGAAEERERVLKLAHAIVDNAAGDTHMGRTIIARIEGGK